MPTKPNTLFLPVFGLLFVLLQTFISLTNGEYSFTLYLMDILAPTVSLLVMLFVIRQHSGARKTFWILIAVCLLCETIAQLIWGSYEWIWHAEAPDIGIADIFWLSQSLIYLIALYGWVCHTGGIKRSFLDSAILLVSFSVVSWEFLIGPIYEGEKHLDIVTLSVDLFYPVSSLLMAFIISTWMLNGEHRLNRRTTIALVLGCLGYVFGDSLYILLIDLQGIDWLEPWIDTFWTGACFCMAAAGLYSLSAEPLEQKAAESRWQRVARFSVPYIGLLLLVGILFFFKLTTDVFVWGLALTVLLVLVRQVMFLLERETLSDRLGESYRRLEQIASCDSLTGLLNRRVFEQELEQKLAGAAAKPVAVMYFDLDKFKSINDTYGHRIGDLLLQTVAARLTPQEGVSIARLGGDEFALSFSSPNITTSRLDEWSALLVETVSAPYELDGLCIRTSPSIGIALYPQDAQSVPGLLDAADQAMYEAKRRGGGTFAYYRSQTQLVRKTDHSRSLQEVR
ncbi:MULTISPECIES: GGDEF domain-containing protein [Paenibacillus]|uniref:GGDEF domain-containing protein n=1 Tax=Paenibacillus TaxID=44249 RepID=UPI0022B88C8E|nr:GGDEF domain-containing protein [Paenibacillus caseinilyticus]MCZ8521014.1 GGDEF domain-containing protein [Paenibacillus caseinilyticus]